MLKAVIFDCGYGGEFFADRLEEEISVIDVIRVIDWRNAEVYLKDYRAARELASIALRPYIGKVDLIVIANHLLSITSLKYFRKKYPNQKFIGLALKEPDTFIQRDTVILTTKALSKTMEYHGFVFRLKRRVKTMVVDDWPDKIDDGILDRSEILETFSRFMVKKGITPQEIILGCSHFEDIKNDLKTIFGRKLRIYSSFDDTIRETCKLLKIRGSVRKMK